MKQTALRDVHVGLGAKMVEFAGWDMPIQYSSIIDEHMTVRKAVGLFDVSHMGEVFIDGNDILSFMRRIFTNDAGRCKPGDMKYTLVCGEDGRIKDDMIFYKRSESEFMVIPNASTVGTIHDWFLSHKEGDVNIENRTDDYFCLALQGPKALDIMEKIGFPDIKKWEFFSFKELELCKGAPVMVCASGYTGEKGVEIVGENEHAEATWNMLMDAGAEFGIKPIGLGARDTLRLEKGFLLSGTDFNNDRTPLEAGVDWAVKWDHDFIGKDVLEKQKEADDFERFRGLRLKERGVPRGHMDIEVDGKRVGATTSGTMSPCLREGIALGYVNKEFKKKGTEVDIVIRDKRVKAEVSKVPFV